MTMNKTEPLEFCLYCKAPAFVTIEETPYCGTHVEEGVERELAMLRMARRALLWKSAELLRRRPEIIERRNKTYAAKTK